MPILGSKIFEVFRNLKSDAVPKAPRPKSPKCKEEEPTEPTISDVTDENEENVDTSNQQEEVIFGTEDFKKNYKPSNFKKPNKNKETDQKKGTGGKNKPINYVNTQATGPVINIVGAHDLHWGNKIVNYIGSSTNSKQTTIPEEEEIKKCNLIKLVMEADIQPDHQYIDHVSKNLGMNWQFFFRKLKYSQGRIETFVIDAGQNGVTEARYKLLLDWVRKDIKNTLGSLATKLWEEGERAIVKELAIIYKKDKQ